MLHEFWIQTSFLFFVFFGLEMVKHKDQQEN